MIQHRLAKRILLHETGGPEMPGSLKATGKSAYSGEQVNRCQLAQLEPVHQNAGDNASDKDQQKIFRSHSTLPVLFALDALP